MKRCIGPGEYAGRRVTTLDTSVVDDVGTLVGANAIDATVNSSRLATLVAEVYLMIGMPLNFGKASLKG